MKLDEDGGIGTTVLGCLIVIALILFLLWWLWDKFVAWFHSFCAWPLFAAGGVNLLYAIIAQRRARRGPGRLSQCEENSLNS